MCECCVTEVSPEDFTAVLLQGCGTYAVEAVFQTGTPRYEGRVRRNHH
jgi:hypothetical protein